MKPPSIEDLKREAESFVQKNKIKTGFSPRERRARIWRFLREFAEKENRLPTCSEISSALKYKRPQMVREDLMDMKSLGQVYVPNRGQYIPVGEEPLE